MDTVSLSYAYLRNVRSLLKIYNHLGYTYRADPLISQTVDRKIGRVLVVFANHAVADEWWCAVSTGPSILSSNIKQITPQLYTYDASQCQIIKFFSDMQFKPIADQFRGRMFLTLESDANGNDIVNLPLPTFPPPFKPLAAINPFKSPPGLCPSLLLRCHH